MIPQPSTLETVETSSKSLAARASVVNRTHRVVREQALIMQEQRSRSRSLLIPITICSSLLLLVCYAMWAILDGYDLTPTGIPDSSYQIFLLLLWMLPITAFLVGLAWFQRGRSRSQQERLP